MVKWKIYSPNMWKITIELVLFYCILNIVVFSDIYKMESVITSVLAAILGYYSE